MKKIHFYFKSMTFSVCLEADQKISDRLVPIWKQATLCAFQIKYDFDPICIGKILCNKITTFIFLILLKLLLDNCMPLNFIFALNHLGACTSHVDKNCCNFDPPPASPPYVDIFTKQLLLSFVVIWATPFPSFVHVVCSMLPSLAILKFLIWN